MAKRRLTLADFEGPNSLNMPSSTNTRGIADPLALQALSWGEDYDVDARRNAIAAAMLAQQVAAPGAAAAPGLAQLTAGLGGARDYRLGGSGDYGMGAGDAPAATGQTPGYVTQTGFPSQLVDRYNEQPPPGAPPDDDSETPGGREDNSSVVDSIMAGIREGNVFSAPNATPATPDFGPLDAAAANANAAVGRSLSDAIAAQNAQTTTTTAAPDFGPLDAAAANATTATQAALADAIAAQNAQTTAPAATGGYVASPTGDPLGGRAVTTTSFTAPGAGKQGDKAADPNDPNAPTDSDAISAGHAAAQTATPSFGAPSFDFGSLNSAAMAAHAAGAVNSVGSFATPAGYSSFATASTTPGYAGFVGGGMPIGSLVAQGMPAPSGGKFGPDFTFDFSDPDQTVADPSMSDTGVVDFTGSAPDFSTGGFVGGAVDMGDLGSQGAVDAAGLTDAGLGGGGGATGFGGGGAAGGALGFGGVDAMGGVAGMNTGGTSETGSVAGGGPSGTGGIGGAGMGGGIGSPGTGDFGGATGTSDTSGGGQGDLGSGEGGPGTI